MKRLERLKSVGMKIHAMSHIMENQHLTDDIYTEILENLHSELGNAIEEYKSSNIVTFPAAYAPSSSRIKGNGPST